ncbi:MAG: rhodanese-like domain-containing protein [Acidobacteriota bacterium]|jgi:rhodanese-related sulfurtransferase|nr:rhodanese-like domain-containing protein [Acidobacteriota bacterium]
MNDFEAAISRMDFHFFAASGHKMDVDEFLQRRDALLLDVRCREETAAVCFPFARLCPVLEIPLHEVPARIVEIPRDKFIGVFCSSGVRNVIIFAYLKSKGYEHVAALSGGYAALTEALVPGKLAKRICG